MIHGEDAALFGVDGGWQLRCMGFMVFQNLPDGRPLFVDDGDGVGVFPDCALLQVGAQVVNGHGTDVFFLFVAVAIDGLSIHCGVGVWSVCLACFCLGLFQFLLPCFQCSFLLLLSRVELLHGADAVLGFVRCPEYAVRTCAGGEAQDACQDEEGSVHGNVI